MNENLIFETTGLVKDSYGNNQHSWTLSYNQGTWIGACLELYKITGEKKYLDIAMRTADYVVNDREKFSPCGILYNQEGGGDGGLFKGIFLRYLSQWILSGKLDREHENRFIAYFLENGKSLWDAALSFPASGAVSCMFGNTWLQRRNDILVTDGKGAGYDASIHLSAVMLFELLDELDRNGFLPEQNLLPSTVQSRGKAYKYYRLEVEANHGGNNLELARWQLFATLPQPSGQPQLAAPDFPVSILTAKHRLTLTKKTDNNIRYVICHSNGVHVYSGILSDTNETFDLQPGVYILQLSADSGLHPLKRQSYSTKIIIG
jgi:hypothetical protein